MEKIQFLGDDGIFSIHNPENYSYLYFPIAGEKGLKSCVTPNLGGDGKIDQESFLSEPVSVENLHNNRSTRNFWCRLKDGSCFSVTGASAGQEAARFTKNQEESSLIAGFMWQTVKRNFQEHKLRAEVTSFVPVNENVEVMHVTIFNDAGVAQAVTPIAALPIYGRSADNIRDHRNVTSMLHRIRTTEHGVLVKPTMSFDEKGHRRNSRTYFVAGIAGNGEKPISFYPSVPSFIGEGGTYTHPRAVYEDTAGEPSGMEVDGKEGMGGIRFAETEIPAGESVEYIILSGITDAGDAQGEMNRLLSLFGTSGKVKQAFSETDAYWQKKVEVRYYTGNKGFDMFMRWVSFQPYLRYLYGCSFLPYHDYGRGGRGWRDLWQDCLSLLLTNPEGIRAVMADNYGGVRMDGTNATIIGSGQGEFVADRNGISRVWMDHGVWPFMTTKLYMDQTGDYGFLLETAPYFKDAQVCRGMSVDTGWSTEYGMWQKTEAGDIYKGTVLEHILLEHLCAFYEVGEHNIMRLRGADWNDALDMAEKNGESVAFTCAYAGNLNQLADCICLLKQKLSVTEVSLFKEIEPLLRGDEKLYGDGAEKREVLNDYVHSCAHRVSGETFSIPVDKLASILRGMAKWLMGHIRKQEWLKVDDDCGWFNSYYDDSGRAVEGVTETGVRMMLTGQVFAIMSGTADKEQVKKIVTGADRYLYDGAVGGYRLNTDFKELKFDMGRMFGFAYGEKENGAVFSHMTVMYANALYKRGFAREGYKALQSLADTSLDFDTSRMYPGIPEYFNSQGRGMYPYLTGAASWYMLTVITEVFGVRGEAGDLCIMPKLMGEQFDQEGGAALTFTFAGKRFELCYENRNRLSFGEYKIGKAECDGVDMGNITQDACGSCLIVKREDVAAMSDKVHRIRIRLVEAV